ncbi:fungal hydrophobin-domain-containing protein [Earliella scabrosa]|nr:fungal hydrophobin-domain-containing protein [Earliella scabrosa]
MPDGGPHPHPPTAAPVPTPTGTPNAPHPTPTPTPTQSAKPTDAAPAPPQPTPANPGGHGEPGAGQCSTGPVQCCNTVAESDSEEGKALLGLLNVDVSDIKGLVAAQCSPITVVGAGRSECSSHAVCCQNNNTGGLVSVGCVPVIL